MTQRPKDWREGITFLGPLTNWTFGSAADRIVRKVVAKFRKTLKRKRGKR